ncbi:DUF4301 family protein [Ekhidna sp.]
MFRKSDQEYISEKGLSLEQVQNQLKKFEEGFPSIKLSSPAIIDDGIIQLANIEKDIQRYENCDASVIKFVPASGAATRMFKALFSFLDTYDKTEESFKELKSEDKKLDVFFSDLKEFAFYNDLLAAFESIHGFSVEEALKRNAYDLVVECLLKSQGLDYGNLPKGLLKFHSYKSFERTPVEEHMTEGKRYATKAGVTKIHFTVSKEHLKGFQNHVNGVAEHSNDLFEISFSVQKEKTDTIASTLNFEPFRDENEKLLFRPAGHGALLENLNELEADIVFVKNIDNVVSDRLKEETIDFKKALAGVLILFQEKIFDLLERHDLGEDIVRESNELLNQIGLKGNFSSEEVPKLLNRPIRVCGMVKNEGEPGGGPFWIKNEGFESLQIIESAQINKSEKRQIEIFNRGTHFNPVDLVLGIRNYKGKKFDLLAYRDSEAGFISEKSYNGEQLLAMELAGLWNGGMAYWNTIFVEVPLSTFSPVKTVTDLLKEAHR